MQLHGPESVQGTYSPLWLHLLDPTDAPLFWKGVGIAGLDDITRRKSKGHYWAPCADGVGVAILPCDASVLPEVHPKPSFWHAIGLLTLRFWIGSRLHRQRRLRLPSRVRVAVRGRVAADPAEGVCALPRQPLFWGAGVREWVLGRDVRRRWVLLPGVLPERQQLATLGRVRDVGRQLWANVRGGCLQRHRGCYTLSGSLIGPF